VNLLFLIFIFYFFKGKHILFQLLNLVSRLFEFELRPEVTFSTFLLERMLHHIRDSSIEAEVVSRRNNGSQGYFIFSTKDEGTI
jgi:hypothetical protein